MPEAPSLAHVLRLEVDVAEPIEVGRLTGGLRRVVPITGGSVSGLFTGRVLPGGADIQLVRSPTQTEVEARYLLESDAGELVAVHNTGLRVADARDTARLLRGEPVDPSRIYFRSLPRFETASPRLARLNSRLFVGVGTRRPRAVELEIFEIQ